MKSFLLVILFVVSGQSWALDCEQEKPIGEYRPHYAKLFSIRYYKDFKIVDSGKDRFIVGVKDHLGCTTELDIISSHVKRFVATSTTHLAFLKIFSLEKSLIGFQGVRYIYNPILRNQKPKEINYQLNTEELLSLKPDLVMAYSANLASEKRLIDLRKVNVPIVLNRDFEEKHPLARAEWVVFSALFFSKDQEAQKFFLEIEKNYKKIQSKIVKEKIKPLVLVGDIQNGQWATCGGKSDLAILINDAGGELLFQSESSETQYFSLEKILSNKKIPKIWLTQNTWTNKLSAQKDSRYKSFLSLPTFNNNKVLNLEGFNDFWETGISRPDLLLKDLYGIFYQEKNLNSNLIWYKKLE